MNHHDLEKEIKALRLRIKVLENNHCKDCCEHPFDSRFSDCGPCWDIKRADFKRCVTKEELRSEVTKILPESLHKCTESYRSTNDCFFRVIKEVRSEINLKIAIAGGVVIFVILMSRLLLSF